MTGIATRDQQRVVIALGGNALIERHHPLDAAAQLANIQRAIAALAPLAVDHHLVITHGNGPQVGLLALESSADATLERPYPLDALGAETQGLIGYWLLQTLGNALPDHDVAALITQTLVAASDPAFDHPTKFIGPVYTAERAHELATARHWTVAPDGTGWRRVVASPTPLAVVEMALIERLIVADTLVICGGGGGIPVTRNSAGMLEGVEAVVDKDLTSALVAEALHADALLLLTDVAAISTDIADPSAPTIRHATPTDLRRRAFPSGSMGPKVEAACQFVERTGRMAAVGALTDAPAILAGTAGTIVTPAGIYP